jgi:hypothetical protein
MHLLPAVYDTQRQNFLGLICFVLHANISELRSAVFVLYIKLKELRPAIFVLYTKFLELRQVFFVWQTKFHELKPSVLCFAHKIL